MLWLAILANLGTLAYLKYAGFFLSSAQNVLSTLGIEGAFPIVATALPVGISFYTFHAIRYSIDVYRGEHRRRTTCSTFALFMSFFPQLVAGPIVRGDRAACRSSTRRRDPRRSQRSAPLVLIASACSRRS